MNLYYNDNLTSKVRELGLPKVNKFKIKRLSVKVYKFYMTNIVLNTLFSVLSLSSIVWGVMK